jgi:spermidine synthase
VLGQKLRTPAVSLLYFVSGLTGLVYEVTFSKYLSYVFGATAYASSAVLVAFMGGLSTGGLVVARWDARLRNRLFWYGAVEVLIGLFSAVSPLLFSGIGAVYVSLAHALPASTPVLTILRCLLATAVVFVPAAAMGATLPLLAPAVTEGRASRWLSTLYALNILGGALGSLVAAYDIIPELGLQGTLRFAALANVAIGLSAVALSLGRARSEAPAASPDPVPAPVGEPGALDSKMLLVLAGASGLLVFAAEVVFVHLLALVIGTSVYAFGLMLAIFLLCLGIGAWAAPIVAAQSRSGASFAAAAAGLALAGTAPVWDRLPGLFDTMAPYATTWAEREAGRAVVAFLALCVPATAMGALFPIVLREVGRGEAVGAGVGRVAAVNTLGSIAGSVVGGFFLVPVLGSQRSLLVLAAAYAALALASAPAPRRRWVAAISAVTMAAAVGAPRWDLARLTSGANVYFESGPAPDAIEMVREDVHGGVTTVVRSEGLLTLYTNGKFQGNNGYELEAQRAFAHIPCLLATRLDNAFAIGLGTGTTLGTFAAYPFRKIAIAEISPAIAEAAKRYYADINGRVLDDARVRFLSEDGRNALLVSTERYDVIGIEISSIWFAGAANLYAREFYEIAKNRLSPGGVLQQWVQFHHMGRRELASVLATIRSVFPHVALYAHGNQGIVVAAPSPLLMSISRAEAMQLRPEVRRLLPPATSLGELAADMLVSEEALDRFIEESASEAAISPAALVSTDDNLYLEYATPKNNVEGMPSIEDTIELIARYRPPDVVARHIGP